MQIYTPKPRERAQEQIEAYILEQGLKVGDRLPPEREMCRMWGLNRTTLRSAIARLEAEGRLSSTQGSGTCLTPRFRRTLQDLQSFTEYAFAGGFQPETRLLAFTIVECDKHLSRRFRRMLGEKLYRISRLRMLDGMPVLLETAFIPVELAPNLDQHDLVNGSLFTLLRENYCLELDHGEEKTSVTLATEEEAAHLGITPGSPVFWIVSQTDSPDGTVIEYCRTVGRADRMELASILRWQNGRDEA